MPEVQGFSHISLSVRDREVSARFYRDVFEFAAFERLTEECYDEIVMLHRATGMILCLQQHRTNRGEPADPARTGADHLAFRVATRPELDAWAHRLAALGVPHSPVADRHYGSVLCLRDPDQFQLELFYRENHP
jgi:glyoxylase I family protein